MRILFLSKRRYMNKDVIDDRYGRLYELPAMLAERGHSILGACTSYRPRNDRRSHLHFEHGELEWKTFDLLPGGLPFPWRLLSLARRFQPDLVFSASDALHVATGDWLARKLGVLHAADLYDNFESFGLTRVPGLRHAYRRALRRSAAISCVSAPLKEKLAREFSGVPLLTLESTIDPDDHPPLERQEARRQLGLPIDAWLVGTAGALHGNRDIRLLYDAFLLLAEKHPEMQLALAGPVDSSCPPPRHPRIHYLGLLPYEQIPVFNSALDLAVICMRESEFGRYAFPQKTYEILACGTPLLAAGVDALSRLLEAWPDSLFQPGNLDSLVAGIERQRRNPSTPALTIPSWKDQARRLESFWKRCMPDLA